MPREEEPHSEKQPDNHHGDQYHSEPQSSSQQGNQLVVLATAMVIALNHHGYSRPARILIDQGSEVSLVSERLVNQLQLKRRSSSLSIVGIGEASSGSTRGVVSFDLQPRHNSTALLNLEAHIMRKLTAKIPPFACDTRTPQELWELNLADRTFLQPGAIDIIIGADYYGKIITDGIMRYNGTGLIAQQTSFGWVVSGPVCCTGCAKKRSLRVTTRTINQQLLDCLKKFWTQEEIPDNPSTVMSKADAECEQHFVETHRRDATGRYTAHTLYRKFIKEYEALDHMQRAPATSETRLAYYLPHHGVLRPDSTTTKLRVVFDASHRSSTGVSLNDILHSGPKLQTECSDVLIWLRRHRLVFGADIEKMFRQIRVHQDDWGYQRIFWKDDDGQIIEYQLTTVTYGTSCAPCLSLRVLKQLAIDEAHRFPLALSTFTRGRYVDDIYGGAETEEELEEIIKDLIGLCMAGGMPLQKWCSNAPRTLGQLGISAESAPTIEFGQSSVKVLGLCWQPQTDTFYFKARNFSGDTITKRVILSEIAQIYDPLGLIAPVTITAKIFIQELWLLKLDWDEQIPMTHAKRWRSFREELQRLSSLSIPRWLHLSAGKKIQLHGFADASTLAMGASVYLRSWSAPSGTNVNLVCAKTKVAPLKKMTIPRLELTAAVMVTNLMAYVQRALELEDAELYLWSDSSVAIAWINGDPSRWKDFVQNRVLKIQETLPTAKWNHINGKENPADCASRGISPTELREHHLWWTGPSWLVQPPEQWVAASTEAASTELASTSELASAVAMEAKPPTISSYPVHIVDEDALINRISSWNKVARITAWVNRAVNKFKGQPTPDSPQLGTTEIEDGRLFWVKYTQRRYFEREINILKTGRSLAAKHRMATLTPYLENDVMRMGGRLRNSTLDLEEKNPIILPRHSPLSSLIIAEAHQRSFHGGTQLTLAHIRQRYWIIGGRAPVRSHILKCVICARHRAVRAQQLMGQLPSRRVTPSRVFLHSGVDFAGPINILRWRGSGAGKTMYKAYICLFVCFATSATHLELVTDLTADGFIAAYKRFTARRGICATLTSDRGLNFIGAEKELRQIIHQASSESATIKNWRATNGTEWRFNPPYSPHMGGKWEAAVKSTKHHLRRVIGNSTLTYEEFTTLLTQVEAILNSRPLCPINNDPQDTTALTPGHFIIGGSLTAIPEPSLEHINTDRLNRWQLITQKVQNFWDHWARECVHRYQQIYRWRKPTDDIKIGTLVLISNEQEPPTRWPLARVIRIHPGRDNLTRIVTLWKGNKETQRAIHRLVPLPINGDLLEGQN
ncbi:uncharacterized protein LOC135172476 [Diachasmimorpha longicaudata]|uniref:uncharacterized protein LOC135172476 n=1 Tax=Diachasmimorpha longicaudata TaxID=58733 RepID=UPI0030B8C146